jgi:hypothetical protein
MRTTFNFKADLWKDNSADWHIFYHVGSTGRYERTITGEVIDCGNLVTHCWSGIRGMSGMTEAPARAAVAILADRYCEGDAERGIVTDDSGCVFGEWCDTHERQPGDDYWMPRTIRAESAGVVEWFPSLQSAQAWIMAHGALNVPVLA